MAACLRVAMRVAASIAFALLRAAALQPPAPRRTSSSLRPPTPSRTSSSLRPPAPRLTSSSLLRAAPAPDAWNAYELGAARALAASAPAKAAAAFFGATGPLPLNAALALPLAAKLDWSRPWRPRPTGDRSRAGLLYGVALVAWAARRAPYASRAAFAAAALRLAVGARAAALGPVVALVADAKRSAAAEAAGRAACAGARRYASLAEAATAAAESSADEARARGARVEDLTRRLDELRLREDAEAGREDALRDERDALADERELLREDLDKSEARLAAQVDAEIHLRGVVAELRGQLRDRGDVVVADEEAWERKLAEKSKALDYVEAELLGLTEIYERKERRLRAEFDAERAALRADLAARDQRRPLAPVAPPEATPPPPRKPPPPPEDTAHLVPY